MLTLQSAQERHGPIPLLYIWAAALPQAAHAARRLDYRDKDIGRYVPLLLVHLPTPRVDRDAEESAMPVATVVVVAATVRSFAVPLVAVISALISPPVLVVIIATIVTLLPASLIPPSVRIVRVAVRALPVGPCIRIVPMPVPGTVRTVALVPPDHGNIGAAVPVTSAGRPRM